MATHFIPDIHGRIEKLLAALEGLGFRETRGAWRHPLGDRVIFLGDFIDRGEHAGEVIRVVRGMIDAGTARAIMGNHELNAIHFHTDRSGSSDGLRARTRKNTSQHVAFLAEFPLYSLGAQEMIGWMKSLPLAYEEEDFRAVHACWDLSSIARLREISSDLVLDETLVHLSAESGHPVMRDIERITKGPEISLPDGYGVHDQEGMRRTHVRAKWWGKRSRQWADIAMSVVDPDELPRGRMAQEIAPPSYPEDERPVFFGHYWLKGVPFLQSANALCLDYSAGLDGPLVTYRHETGAPLDLARIMVHAAP